MQNLLVLTVVGKDRTGLIRSLSKHIADYGGNWLESRMCRLGGEFAGILSIHVPEEKEQALIKSLQALHADGLTVIVHQAETAQAGGVTKSASLNLIGQDRPGILYQLSAALARHGINVEELETECTSAPMSGEMIFKAAAKLQIPESCILAAVRRELEEMGNELMVEISFRETN